MIWMAEILTMVAIAITGVQDAEVLCVKKVNWDKTARMIVDTPGNKVDGFALVTGPTIWVKGRHCKKLATLDRRSTSSAILPLFVFTHELGHVAGYRNEYASDCYSVLAAKRTAKLLNARNPFAAKRAVKRWAWLYWDRRCPSNVFKNDRWFKELPREL